MTARPAALPLLVTLIACSSSPNGPAYEPDLPQAWAVVVDNRFFPLVPGARWRYEAETDEGVETIIVEVQAGTRIVNGVTATVVHDRVHLDGALIEDTYDWYAQDAAGNVWYLGEESMEVEAGRVVGTEGSWEWGVDGALPGIIMWADPAAHVGAEYRQEYYEGEAEDWGRVVALDQTVTVPLGTFTGCLQTEDWNGLETGSLEHKFYCPATGVTLEIAVQGGGERVELVERS